MSIHIKVTKLAGLEGRPNGESPIGSIEEGYTVWGFCKELPKVGQYFGMKRYKRNDVMADGVFTTSLIKEILQRHGQPTLIKTENSVYEYEILRIEPSITNQPIFKPLMNKDICMEQVSSLVLRVYDELEKEGFTFGSVDEDNAFHDSLTLFFEETFNWPDYASYN